MVENREFAENIEAREENRADRDTVAEAMTTRTDIVEGMETRDSNGEFVGGVSEVRETHFLLDRPMARDLWVPYSAVAEVGADRIVLNVTDLDDMGWEKPPLIGSPVV